MWSFIQRKNKQIFPTEKGINLIKVLPDTVKSAKMTAEWEANLKLVEQGELSADEFMKGITNITVELVNENHQKK